ncbi:MAG: GNAT family N-acetyltransferase [Pseudomonadota bacterium]
MSYSLTPADPHKGEVSPVIETERLILRGWKQADHARLAELHGDEANARFIGVYDFYQSWIRLSAMQGSWSLRGFGPFAVTAKRDGVLLGFAGPWLPEGMWKEPELCYGFHPDSQGKGYATEAASACLRYVYETLAWPEAISCIDGENKASIALAEKLGARFERNIKMYKTIPAQVWRYPYPAEFDENWKLWGAE